MDIYKLVVMDNKKRAWDCKVNVGEKFDFLPALDEEEEIYEDYQELK
jgi:hypothetical protein